MTRQVRAYEETAQLIEALIRRDPTKSFADILHEWAERLYPETYETIQEKMEVIDETIDRDSKRNKQ